MQALGVLQFGIQRDNLSSPLKKEEWVGLLLVSPVNCRGAV